MLAVELNDSGHQGGTVLSSPVGALQSEVLVPGVDIAVEGDGLDGAVVHAVQGAQVAGHVVHGALQVELLLGVLGADGHIGAVHLGLEGAHILIAVILVAAGILSGLHQLLHSGVLHGAAAAGGGTAAGGGLGGGAGLAGVNGAVAGGDGLSAVVLHLGAVGGDGGAGGSLSGLHLADGTVALNGGVGAGGGDGVNLGAALGLDGGALGVLGDGHSLHLAGHGQGGVLGGGGQGADGGALAHGDGGVVGGLGDVHGVHLAGDLNSGAGALNADGAQGTLQLDVVGTLLHHNDGDLGAVLHSHADLALLTGNDDLGNLGAALDDDGVGAAAADQQTAVHSDVVQLHMALAHALGHDEVAGDVHILEGYVVGADDGGAVHVAGVLAGGVVIGVEDVVQNGDNLSAGDGVGGTEQAIAALHVPGGGHGVDSAHSPVGDGGLIQEAGVGSGLGVQAQHPGEHDGGLLAGDGGAGLDSAVTHAHDDAGGVGAQNGVGVPALIQVGEGILGLELVGHDPVQHHGHLAAGDAAVGHEVAVLVALDDAVVLPGVQGVLGPVAGSVSGGKGGSGLGQHKGTGQKGSSNVLLQVWTTPFLKCMRDM